MELRQNITKLDNAAIEVGEFIGKGAFGRVNRGKLTLGVDHKIDVAIKRPTDNSRNFASEAQIHTLLGDLKGVPKFYGITENPRNLIMEFCHGHTMLVAMKRQNKFRVLEGFMQACETVQCMHDRRIVHRDLNLRNIMMDFSESSVETRVIDFGRSDFKLSNGIDENEREDNCSLVSVASKFVRYIKPEHPATKEFIDKIHYWRSLSNPPAAREVADLCRTFLSNPVHRDFLQTPNGNI